MTEYVSKDAVRQMLGNRYGGFLLELDAMPAADVVPVVHGRWLSCEVHNDIEQCSECGMIFHYPSYYGYKFCPNCGAKMDKEVE